MLRWREMSTLTFHNALKILQEEDQGNIQNKQNLSKWLKWNTKKLFSAAKNKNHDNLQPFNLSIFNKTKT